MTSGALHLVTGGGGYLGANLIRALLADPGVRIRRFYRQGKELPPHPSPRVEDCLGDARNPEDLDRALDGVEVVYHLASQTSVYVANDHPPEDWEANAKPLLNLLEASRARLRPLTIIAAGTVTQTGIPDRLPVDESHPDRPLTVYCMHKQLAEFYLKHYTAKGWAKGCALRLANVYGPGPRNGSADRGILNAMMRKALAGEEIRIYGRGDFIRDYVYVEDVARAFAAAGAHPDAVNGRHFVVGSGTGHLLVDAINMVADAAAERTGSRAPVSHVEAPGGLSPIETRNFVADPSALAQTLGWKAEVGLAEGIRRTLGFYIQKKEFQ
jgi:nucleoside-diphosphate-sugar epimerase